MPNTIRRAVQLIEKGQPDKAERLFLSLLAFEPDHAEALHRLGLLKFGQGRHAEALDLLNLALQSSPRDVATLSNRGLVYAALGRPVEALANYDAALALQPDLVGALNNRGIALRQLDRREEALASYEQALALKPEYAEAHHNRGNTLRDLGRADEALSHYDRALAIEPRYADALVSRAAALRDLGRPEEALASCDRALAVNPGHVEALNTRGNALSDLCRHEQALESYDKAIMSRPNYAAAIHSRGLALRALGRFEEALTCFDGALALAPNFAEAFNSRGVALRALDRWPDALASYDRALALDPLNAEAHSNRANALLDLRRPEEALASCERALALDPGYAEAHNNRANALLDLQRPEEALAAYDRALALDPRSAITHDNKGVALEGLGRFDQAADEFDAAIRLAPRRVRSYYNITTLERGPLVDSHLKAMEELARDMHLLSRDEQIELNFALGRALAEAKDFGRSFPYLLKGNALKRQTKPYDEAGVLSSFERTRAIFDASTMRRMASQGDPSARPIFIFGMLRSGTTLVEQILASHPEVRAAGETDLFAMAMAAVHDGANGTFRFPEDGLSLSARHMPRLGALYVNFASARARGREKIADKTIDNFRFAGLIHLALPNARLLHVRRNPVDACLSCFAHLFAGHHPYAYDLGELGRYRRGYDRLMAHWRDVIPRAAMIEVQYEDIVADLEGQARRIVAHCGLEWDARCLEFHLTERLVRTASAAQVRQPIFRDSMQRWRAYEPLLGPLLQELRPLAA